MPQPKELQDGRRGVGPWSQNRLSPKLRMGRDDLGMSPLSHIPEPSQPGIMPIERFVKEVVVPFGQRIVAAQDRVAAKINQLLNDFPTLSDFSRISPSNFVLAAETAGFANTEQLIYASSLRDRIGDLKDQVDRRLSQLSSRSLAPGVPVVILDTFVPKDKQGTRHVSKKNVLYAAGGAVGGLTLAGIILKACEAVSASQGHPTPSNPSMPIGPGFTPTPEGGVGVHPLVVVCPNPTQMGDQKYPLSAVTSRMQGIVEFKNVNPTDSVLATQLEDAINKQFGPNDFVICSPAFGEGVSPVISVYPFDNAGGGNFKWFVMLADGRLVGPKEDRLFTTDNKWVQPNDVAHYSLGRVGEGKFDSMVYTAPRKNATDPEIIVGILDRTSGRVLTGKEMIDKYGDVFSNVPFAILASLDQFRQSIPANLLSQVDHFGYVPTPTPDGKTGLKLAALRSDGTVVLAQGQEIPKATITPSPTPRPTETARPTETLAPTVTPKPEITPIPMKVIKEFKLTTGDYKSAGYVGTNREFSVPPTSFYEAIKDPTGMFGGEYIIHSRIDGPPPDTKAIKDNSGVHRPYPVYYTTEGSGSWALEFSSVLTALPTSEVYTNSGGGAIGKKWYSVVSAGVATSDNPTNIKAGAFLVTDRGVPHLELYTQNKSPSSSVDNPSRYTKPLPYPVGEKVRIRLEFLQGDSGQPKVRLFQNDIFIDETTIEAKDALGLPGKTFRTGLYAGQGVRGPLEIYEGELKIYVP